MYTESHHPRRVIVTREEVANYIDDNPDCNLRHRAYWFEFDREGAEINNDVPQHDEPRADQHRPVRADQPVGDQSAEDREEIAQARVPPVRLASGFRRPAPARRPASTAG